MGGQGSVQGENSVQDPVSGVGERFNECFGQGGNLTTRIRSVFAGFSGSPETVRLC